MQQDQSPPATVDWHSERLALLMRQAGAWLGRIPAGFWRFCIKLFIVVWLAHTLANLVWVLVPAPEVRDATVAANALSAAGSDGGGRTVDIEQLSGLTIFGKAAEGDAPEELAESADTGGPAIEDQAVDTDLNLVLRGVMGSNDAKAARAIIAEGSSQAIYAPGDELPVPGNVTLEKVLPLRVILDNAGRYESLWLYNGDDWSSDLADSQPVPDTPSRSWEGDDDGTGEASTEASEAEASPEPRPREQMEEAADEVAQRVGTQSLSDVVSMSIHREGGQIVGYRIRPGRDRALFDSLGLEANDVVKAVNGVELTSPQRVMEIYREMGDARSASLLIERGGQELTIDIELE